MPNTQAGGRFQANSANLADFTKVIKFRHLVEKTPLPLDGPGGDRSCSERRNDELGNRDPPSEGGSGRNRCRRCRDRSTANSGSLTLCCWSPDRDQQHFTSEQILWKQVCQQAEPQKGCYVKRGCETLPWLRVCFCPFHVSNRSLRPATVAFPGTSWQPPCFLGNPALYRVPLGGNFADAFDRG